MNNKIKWTDFHLKKAVLFFNVFSPTVFSFVSFEQDCFKRCFKAIHYLLFLLVC